MSDDAKLLDELEALEKKATKGPWGVRDDHPNRACLHVYPTAHDFSQESVADCYSAPGDRMVEDLSGKWIDDPERVANASLIPAARNALPLLLRLARRGLAAGEFIASQRKKLDEAWGFDNDQQHTHTWHTKQDYLEAWDAALSRLAEQEGA